MSNLTNVYAYLRNNYTDIDMLFGKPPTYIKTLNEINNQKVIFIYKEDRSKLSKSYGSPLTEGDKSCDTDLNVTGSPLKDDNSINNLINSSIATKLFVSKPWKEIESSYMPINIEIARKILTDIANYKFPKESRGWIFILCEKESRPITNSEFILSLNLGGNKFSRGLAKYHGIIKNEDKSMKNLLMHHGNLSANDINIESIFEITPNISLRFMNTFSQELPTLNHINERSQVMLYQKIEIGKSHILCENLWRDIWQLNVIKNDIVNVKNNSCDGTLLEPTFDHGSLTYDKLQANINQILSDVVTVKENGEDGVSDTHLEAVIKRMNNRVLMDLTDQLWEVLRSANSYMDLRKSLTYIFQISSRSSIVNIPMNNNRMSELIRELSQQRLAIPHLSSTEPLELLLEMGLEKVMKDYELIFNESKICNLKDIKVGERKGEVKSDDYMSVRKSLASTNEMAQTGRKTLLHAGTSLESNDDDDDVICNSRFNQKETEVKISKLAQTHLAIEHILMMQNNLDMDHDYTFIAKKLLENPLVPFEELEVQKYDKFEIPITDKKVIQLVKNLIPNSQKIRMKSENKFKATENVFYFNIEQIVPMLVQKENEDEIVNKEGDVFQFISYTNITSKF